MKKLIIFFAFLIVGSGCEAVRVSNFTEKKVDVVKNEKAAVNDEAMVHAAQTKKLEERIEALEQELVGARMDYISRINNLEVDITDQDDDIEKLYKEMEKFLKKKLAMKRAMRKKKAKEMASMKKKPIFTDKQMLEQNYTKAIDFYTAGSYQESLKLLNNLIIGKAKMDLQDNIYYWRGMNEFQLNSFTEAIKNFQVVIESYPKENKYYDAKLMVAVSHGMMGDKSLAINELKRLEEENIPEEIKAKAKKAIAQFQK
ncbi:MAG: hypothetical protein HQK84_12715 [Nitrospinae bacterium]|nr:hypothetical protein [Nitrospinota bacterium]